MRSKKPIYEDDSKEVPINNTGNITKPALSIILKTDKQEKFYIDQTGLLPVISI